MPHPETEQLQRALERALDQQTATSEILRAMSASPPAVQPVFDAIVRSGLRLLHGYSASMMLLREGESLDLVAYTSTSAEADASLVHIFPMPLRALPPGERAVRDRRPHAVEDVATAADVSDVMRETGRRRGWHANLFIPMLREGVALGLISITRRDPGPFAADEIALLETFAAQAVIAIENVRLFTELEGRNRDLTATSEILRVISSSPTHVQPVFDAIVGSSKRLLHAAGAIVFRRIGDEIHLAAHTFHGDPSVDRRLPGAVRSHGGRQSAVDPRMGQWGSREYRRCAVRPAMAGASASAGSCTRSPRPPDRAHASEWDGSRRHHSHAS